MTPPTPIPSKFVATATIVGRGRVGRALANALASAGVTVSGPTARGERIPDADVILLCVPDAAIAGVTATVRGATGLVGHMSGATPLSGSGAQFGLHPLQSFAGTEGADAFRGIGCAIAGESPAALEVAREVAIRIGARPFAIDDAHRAGYHAAASFASNFVLTLLDAAEQVAATAGLTAAEARELLAPLVRSTVENWMEVGPAAALTGPIARGDEKTVGRQREAVGSDAPHLLPLFDVLADTTRSLAERTRSLGSAEALA